VYVFLCAHNCLREIHLHGQAQNLKSASPSRQEKCARTPAYLKQRIGVRVWEIILQPCKARAVVAREIELFEFEACLRVHVCIQKGACRQGHCLPNCDSGARNKQVHATSRCTQRAGARNEQVHATSRCTQRAGCVGKEGDACRIRRAGQMVELNQGLLELRLV
jgi:hypothetical protein